jgi:hypothetical protein
MLQFPRQQGDIRIPTHIMPRAFINIGDDGDDRLETSGLCDARYGTTTYNILHLTSVEQFYGRSVRWNLESDHYTEPKIVWNNGSRTVISLLITTTKNEPPQLTF